MRQLRVEGFSCIDKADLKFGDLTVIIGPQASGKSVLSKLAYFFLSILQDQYRSAEEEKTIAALKAGISARFNEWFPVSAWGQKKFCIEFEAGHFSVRITRSAVKEKLSEKIRVTLSPFFEAHYSSLVDALDSARKKRPLTDDAVDFDVIYRIQERSEKELAKAMGSDYVASQTFVPAGRSFFTNIGKAIVAFEQGRLLDPLTTRFGRLYTSYRERWFMYGGRAERSHQGIEARLMKDFFGGTLRRQRDSEFLETSDGRKIPFSALSSGQQELLPLVMVLGVLGRLRTTARPGARRLMYIEEPEAHLFPSAQNLVVEALAEVVAFRGRTTDMVLTTHSPYVLAKINNLIKAGELAEQLGEQWAPEISAVVPQRTWLAPNAVKAYAIVRRELRSIMGKDGLIDGEYLDDVSGDIGREFSALLEIEAKHGAA